MKLERIRIRGASARTTGVRLCRRPAARSASIVAAQRPPGVRARENAVRCFAR